MARIWNKYKQSNTPLKRKVFVGLSGGVDSAVAAALLKKQVSTSPRLRGASYDVTGVFIRIWNPVWGECNWKDDRREAMRVALALNIPFKTLDLSKEYQREVADFMIAEYQAGRTPNPDILCNSQIKFGWFLKWSLKNGADFIATGHYARLQEIKNPKPKIQNNIKYQISNTQLFKGIDNNKDQSYFLWQLTQMQLQRCLFPIGEFKKSEVRAMAKKFKLPNVEKKDSQGICFIGKVGMKDFLKKYIKEKKGDVLDETGKVIGYHDGACFLTIGQRHGFTITKKGTGDKPCYIIGKDIQKNTVTVSNKKTKKLENKKTIVIENVNWISSVLEEGKIYQCRIRHLGQLYNCQIFKKNKKGEYEVVLTKKLDFVAPGQSLVIYDKEQCVGGGVIA